MNNTDTGDIDLSWIEHVKSALPQEVADAIGALADQVHSLIDRTLPADVENPALAKVADVLNGIGDALTSAIAGSEGDTVVTLNGWIESFGKALADDFTFDALGKGLPTITEFALDLDLLGMSADYCSDRLVPGDGYFMLDDSAAGDTVGWDATGGPDGTALVKLTDWLLPSDFHLV